MSASKVAVTIQVPDAATGISVVDSNLREIASGFGRISTTLQPGIYKARSRVGADATEKLFVVEPGSAEVTVSLDKVPFASAIPFPGSRGSHEYQATALAKLCSPAPGIRADDAEVALMVRDPDMTFGGDPPGGLNAYAEALTSFAIHRIDDRSEALDISQVAAVD